ncbi:MAG TPA: DUF4397 domain-containing protein [Mucilaginibacter sp.]|nr:DUF4397 domain-containing protein [Mucilaginibacter sp.]
MKTIINTQKIKTLSASFFALVLLSFMLTSCSKDKSNTSLSAYIKVTNSAQGSQPQDFYLNNTMTSATSVSYGESSDFVTASTADKQGSFKTSGSGTVNATFNLSLAAGKYYDVFYADDNSTTTAQDDRTAPQSGKARVRFINLSSAVQSNVDFGIDGGAKLVSAIGYKAASAYYDVDPASAFDLYLSGSSSALLSIPALLQAGHIYTIYVSGTSSASLSSHVIAEN